MMGGIATDLNGRASLIGLYAVGECSCTGLHGANRLASNSLSECFVFGARAARAALTDGAPPPGRPQGLQAPTPDLPAESRDALWRHAGIERNGDGLAILLEDEHPLVRLIARSALTRQESRGAHQRSDFPDLDPALDGLHVTLAKGREPSLRRWE
jgi:L-aspartate oxidase